MCILVYLAARGIAALVARWTDRPDRPGRDGPPSRGDDLVLAA